MSEKLNLVKLWQETRIVTHRNLVLFSVFAAISFFLPSLFLGLLFRDVTAAAAGGRIYAPTGIWPFVGFNILFHLIGWTNIVAVAADPDECDGMPVLAILRSALPAVVKNMAVGLMLVGGMLVAALGIWTMVGIIGFVVTVIASGGAVAAGNGRLFNTIVGALMVLVMVLLMVWVTARLLPTTGVFLRERVGIFVGMERAWALSDGSVWPIIKFGLVFFAISFAFPLVSAVRLRLGLIDGTGGFVAAVVTAGLSAALAMVQAVGAGVVYRQLAAWKASN